MRLILALLCLFSSVFGAELPLAPYLSWKGDPTSTMVVQWHTSQKQPLSALSYRQEGSNEWREAIGTSNGLPKSALLVHSVELVDLQADTMYQFRLGETGSIYKFRTCPKDLKRPLKFAIAGDVYFYLYLLRKMNQEIASSDPDFVIVGGDLAYTHGHKTLFKGRDWEAKRWGTFFREWHKQMVAPDGRLIPMLVVVGNHDVKPHELGGAFYSLFAFPEKNKAYRALDFGPYFSLFLLDTNHTHPIGGEQALWLEEALSRRAEVPFKIPVYHVGAYPSVYPYESRVPKMIRELWTPLFEKHGVKLAFENHNHAYKRTHPIKAGKVDPEGVVYLGDGAWGVSPRKPKNIKNQWYMAKSAQLNCFWLVTLSQEGYAVKSLNREGKLIEELPHVMLNSLTQLED